MSARIVPYGDTAVLVELDDLGAAHRLAAAVEVGCHHDGAPAGVGETVVGMATVVVHLDPEGRPDTVGEWVARLASAPGPGPGALPTAPDRPPLTVPVVFDGADLDGVAADIGETPDRVVALLTGAELTVAFLGFAPGFPYLVGLPPALADVPRRASPRPEVPAGSVAIGGGFASVYPGTTPGGWRLLGRTTLVLFDADRPPHARLRPGDRVRFAARDPSPDPGPAPPRPPRLPIRARGPRVVEVLEPGLLTLLEDGGRRGVAGLGVPRAGAADPDGLRLANRLAGNPEHAAALEVTASGPTLRFTADTHIAVVGAETGPVTADRAPEIRLDGHPVAAGSVSPVRNGQVVSIGRVGQGLRAYLAVGGGFDTPLLFGSRSTDVLSGLGPGPLRVGDRLDFGPPPRPRGRLDGDGAGSRPTESTALRVVDGPHPWPAEAARALVSGPWVVGGDSNRIGVRLERPARAGSDRTAALPAAPGIRSTGMVTGAVQLPPDGGPIILLADHATVGGYPVVACVIAADLPRLGQLRPGDTVTLVRIDLATAHRERLEHDRRLAGLVTGWFPTRAAT